MKLTREFEIIQRKPSSGQKEACLYIREDCLKVFDPVTSSELLCYTATMVLGDVLCSEWGFLESAGYPRFHGYRSKIFQCGDIGVMNSLVSSLQKQFSETKLGELFTPFDTNTVELAGAKND